MEDLPTSLRADLQLLVSELVANSVRHAALAHDDWIRLWARVGPATVRVEVSDPGKGFLSKEPGPEGVPQPRSGLWLVENLADRWGMERDGVTRVWFETDLPSGQGEALWQRVVATWPEESRELAAELHRLFGPPDTIGAHALAWHRPGNAELTLRAR